MLTVKLVAALALIAPGASQDNNVEWNGVSHVGWLDRTPQVPVDGESFTIRFQTFHFDIESARVWVDDGSAVAIDATFAGQEGPYDIWTAVIPATAATSLSYTIELTDGTDTDYLGAPGLGADGMSETGPVAAWQMDYVNHSHAPLGATLTSDGGAVFGVWAPGVTSAAVRGMFNDWGCTTMTDVGDGHWYAKADGVLELDNYKFYFDHTNCDNGNWQQDARYATVNYGDNANSVIIDQNAYAWNDAGFTIPPFEEMVIYELHVGTFSGYNDGLNRAGRYRDVVDTHLDDLLYLGVNTVELMPVTEFDYYESWGYNPINNWAPEEAYGSPDDLRYMVDVLHQNGIAVIGDIVYNHFSPDGNYLWCYDSTQIYFEGTCGTALCDTPWGSQADFRVPEVFDYYADNILFWLDQYHFDGFRMDATRYMRRVNGNGCYDAGWDLMQYINDEIDVRKAGAISIAEDLPNDTYITRPTAAGGAGFDSQWHDVFNDDIRAEIIDAASDAAEMWRVRAAIQDSAYPTKTHVTNYVESHDEGDDARLAVVIDGTDPDSMWAKGRTKLAQGLTILAPGIPLFLQGGEFLETRPFGSSSSNRIDWSKATTYAPILRFFHDAIRIRKSNCALRSDQAFDFFHYNESSDVLGLHRWSAFGNDLVMVFTFGNSDLTDYRIGFPQPGTWHEILNSQASDYDGNGWGNGGSITTEAVAHDGLAQSAEIVIPQMGLLVFRHEDPTGRSADLDYDGDVDLRDYAQFQHLTLGTGGCGMNADLNEDGRLTLEDFATFSSSLNGPN